MTAYKKIEYESTPVLVARAEIAGTADSATTASKVGTATVGSASEPVYINEGTPTKCTDITATSIPYTGITDNPWSVTDVII